MMRREMRVVVQAGAPKRHITSSRPRGWAQALGDAEPVEDRYRPISGERHPLRQRTPKLAGINPLTRGVLSPKLLPVDGKAPELRKPEKSSLDEGRAPW